MCGVSVSTRVSRRDGAHADTVHATEQDLHSLSKKESSTVRIV